MQCEAVSITDPDAAIAKGSALVLSVDVDACTGLSGLAALVPTL